MARGGRRYKLIVYEHMLNRWWPATLAIALGMGVLAYSVYIEPFGKFLPWRWQVLAGVGVFSFIITIIFLILRRLAFVQAFPNYLLVATPFIRINISYKRFKRVTTTEIRALFPPRSLSGWREDIIAPLGRMTAFWIELNGYPIPAWAMRAFFSVFFFKPRDKTPHLIILVNDWMRFSAELDSMRTGTGPQQPKPRTNNSILSKLPQK